MLFYCAMVYTNFLLSMHYIMHTCIIRMYTNNIICIHIYIAIHTYTYIPHGFWICVTAGVLSIINLNNQLSNVLDFEHLFSNMNISI